MHESERDFSFARLFARSLARSLEHGDVIARYNCNRMRPDG